MVQYSIAIVLTTASTLQSHTTSPNKKTTKHAETRENVGDQVVIGFSFESDWLKEWYEFSGPITERSKALTKR